MRTVVDEKTGEPIALLGGDSFTVLGLDPERDCLVAKVERAPGKWRRRWRRAVRWKVVRRG